MGDCSASARVASAITAHTESGGLFGEDSVNVLLLNLALDQLP